MPCIKMISYQQLGKMQAYVFFNLRKDNIQSLFVLQLQILQSGLK